MTDTEKTDGVGKTNGSGTGTAIVDPVEEALNALRSSAMAGEIEAKTELGQRLLGEPRHPNDLIEGAAVTVSAASDGSGEDAYRAAVLAAGAISMPRNWETALVYCRRAAELGYRPAQTELAELSGDQELAARALSGEDSASDIWAQLCDSVNLMAHMTPPTMKSISLNPRIATVENFLAPEICAALVEMARARLEPLGIEGDESVGVDVAGVMRLSATDLSLQLILLLDRIMELVGLPHRGLEQPAIIRFTGGKDYPAHVDYLDPADPERAEMIMNTGQRAVTFLIFLNDDFAGGETDFPSIPLQFKAKKGDALFWWNTNNDGVPMPATLNGNCAVTEGEKWVFSQSICVPMQRVDQPPPTTNTLS
jgi:prolyl 4-hydroxylase